MKDRCRKPMKCKRSNSVRKAVIEAYVKHKGNPTMQDIIDAMDEYCGLNRIEYGRVEDPFEYD